MTNNHNKMKPVLSSQSDGICHYRQGNVFCLFDSEQITDFQPNLLSSDYWLAHNQVVGQAHGRGTTYFVEYPNPTSSTQPAQWVLRHYYRGGLVGKVNRDRYLFQSLAKTRAFAEFSLLQTMRKQGLPAPKPVACRVIKHGFSYQADLLTSRVENSEDLVGILSKRPIAPNVWQTIGKVIARFHQQGIYHHDLNAHNILIDGDNQVWLIDFDRGEQRSVKASWQQANMARLQRSFLKEQANLANFHWHTDNWQQLMLGYAGAN